MDIQFELNGDLFVWNEAKAGKNLQKHGVRFEEAATVFADPFFVLVDAGRNDEARDAVIGLDMRRTAMLSERLKNRLTKDRPMTSITLRIPVDVVESMKAIAPQRGFSGYQALLKSYLSEGLRRDEAQFATVHEARLIETLKRLGVPAELIEKAEREVKAA